MRRLILALVLLTMACGDDPSFDALIADWLVSYSGNGKLYGRTYNTDEMTRVDCTLAGKPVICFTVDEGCGMGFDPSVCFTKDAELAGCIDGAERHPREPLYVNKETAPNGRPRAIVTSEVFINPMLINEWTPCEDQR